MLQLIAQMAAASALTACGQATETAPATATDSAPAVSMATDLAILASVAFDLFPFPTLPPALYLNVAETLLAANDPVVTAGLEQLRSAAGATPWVDVAEAERVAVLATLQDTPFFALMRSTTIAVLFREPVVFDLVGYGGSAVEQGGYLDRGFDDITWLPEAR
jgi:hypothetical protein